MSVTFKDVVYSVGEPYQFVWCEYRARLHTLVEVRYQIEAYEAAEEFVPDRVFRKGRKLGESSWKKTPKKARDDVADDLGIALRKEDIVYEKTFSVSIPIVDEEF